MDNFLTQYDEWGNYIGPELDSSGVGVGTGGINVDLGDERADDFASDVDGGMEDERGVDEDNIMEDHTAGGRSNAIVLHEDKQQYPDASEVYVGAETLVADEDTQPLSQPLVTPRDKSTFVSVEIEKPDLCYTPEFLAALLGTRITGSLVRVEMPEHYKPDRVRNIAIIGALHAGKTTLSDALIEATRVKPWAEEAPRWTDALRAERERGVSIKMTPFTVALRAGGESAPTFALNCLDAPGHSDFADETIAALRGADGALLVVDIIEGVTAGTERAARLAARARAPVVVVLAKLDRLILDLRLPPLDAYYKIVSVIAEVNTALAAAAAAAGGGQEAQVVSPSDGSVVFAGAAHGWTFSLSSWARATAARWDGAAIDTAGLAARLWGDVWFDSESRRFRRTSPRVGAPRTFVQFVLEPLWKIYSTVVGEDDAAIARLTIELGIVNTTSAARSGVLPALRSILRGFLGGCDGVTESLVMHVSSPAVAAPAWIHALYTGDATEALLSADSTGPLMAHVFKLLPKASGDGFLALARILSGTLVSGARVRVLGEAYSAEDSEDATFANVLSIALPLGRQSLLVTYALPGSIVLLDGLGDAVSKTATLVEAGEAGADAAAVRPLVFDAAACVHVSVEPLNPSELPKVLMGLRAVTKSYPLARIRVEESGEHVLIGTGELALDCMLRDLRDVLARVEVKVADPVVGFNETALEQSSIPCFALTPNKLNKFTIIAEPLEKGLAADIESGAVSLAWERKRVSAFFESRYGWDLLAARGVWAFGPTPENGPNIFLDDTLAGEVDKRALVAARDSIVQGFQWATREGPLCDEPVRGVKFRLVGAMLAAEALQRSSGQVIPTTRRAVYASFLLAAPRLMEPMASVEVLCPSDALAAVAAVLAKRRGHVVSESPRPGTPLFCLRGFLPIVDSFGFETDLRVFTQGAAATTLTFDHWSLVPGDPLDRSIVLRPLEAAPLLAIARDFMVKTRRRKGLAEDVSASKYYDAEMLQVIAASE